MMRRQIEIKERTDRYVDAFMAEVRAERAEQEAREKAKAEEFRRLLERDGGMSLLTLCSSEHGSNDDKGAHG